MFWHSHFLPVVSAVIRLQSILVTTCSREFIILVAFLLLLLCHLLINIHWCIINPWTQIRWKRSILPVITALLSTILAVFWEHVGRLSIWCWWGIFSFSLSIYELVLDGEIVLLEVRIASIVILGHVHWLRWCKIWLSIKRILFRIIRVLIRSACAFRLDVLENWDDYMDLHFNFFGCIFWLFLVIIFLNLAHYTSYITI